MKFKSHAQRKAVMAKLNRQRSPLLYNIKSLPKNVDHLPVETSIVVPTTDKNQKKISAKEEKKRVDEVRLLNAKLKALQKASIQRPLTEQEFKIFKELANNKIKGVF